MPRFGDMCPPFEGICMPNMRHEHIILPYDRDAYSHYVTETHIPNLRQGHMPTMWQRNLYPPCDKDICAHHAIRTHMSTMRKEHICSYQATRTNIYIVIYYMVVVVVEMLIAIICQTQICLQCNRDTNAYHITGKQIVIIRHGHIWLRCERDIYANHATGSYKLIR